MNSSVIYSLQLFDRLKLFGMPPKHQPDFIYLRHVPLRKVHLFTLIQLSCLILLWVIKASPAAIVFPMMVKIILFGQELRLQHISLRSYYCTHAVLRPFV